MIASGIATYHSTDHSPQNVMHQQTLHTNPQAKNVERPRQDQTITKPSITEIKPDQVTIIIKQTLY